MTILDVRPRTGYPRYAGTARSCNVFSPRPPPIQRRRTFNGLGFVRGQLEYFGLWAWARKGTLVNTRGTYDTPLY